MVQVILEKQRQFALDVVRRLRESGFEAYWAGGCVRDELLGRSPKDFDVATNATPEQVRQLFGRRRTFAVGAAFGVITVVGPKPAGQVEVTTFRRDAAYSDGRHPDAVIFSSAKEDAQRRDFTINGLFFDPIEGRVIDFVDGQTDLARRVIRAIGDPRERFSEDKLRMLRAVRFAAAFDFVLDSATATALEAMADQIAVVSPERIAMEMRRMLVEPHRVRGVWLLLETGLAAHVLPEILVGDDQRHKRLTFALAVLHCLGEPSFPLALAALLAPLVDASAAKAVCRRWRLSNKETAHVAWLVGHRDSLHSAQALPWSSLQPLFVAEGIEELVALFAAQTRISGGDVDVPDWCRRQLARPRDELDPPPLLNGDDLLGRGIPSGPRYRWLLQQVRNAQLDGAIHSHEDALALVDSLQQQSGQGRPADRKDSP